MDYGHSIQFGTFITPVDNPPQVAVDLARLSEQLGLDLVTFQDHPYQPAFHDTWTLLSWVAAQTETIRVAGNVLNVPMRPAPVLARAVASLDRLSGGRFLFGIGAGWNFEEMRDHGTDPKTRGALMDERIAILGPAEPYLDRPIAFLLCALRGYVG